MSKNLSLPSDDELAAQIAAFSASIEPERKRWEYCLPRVCHNAIRKDGEPYLAFQHDKMGRVTRLLGREAQYCRFRLGRILTSDYTSASETFKAHGMGVGALQPWLLGHVYFARIASHPHIMKVGFSRRVRPRLEDIQRLIGEDLLTPVIVVGTGADEQWWHHEWQDNRISGEWFFDPMMTESSLPDFLQTSEEKAA